MLSDAVKRVKGWAVVMARVLALSLSLYVALASPTVAFATSRSQSEGVAWANGRAREGWSVDYDGAYGVQCVDLILAYYDYLEGWHTSGNAIDYAGNTLPSGWTRVYSDPRPGDVIVWNRGAQLGNGSVGGNEWADSTYGHIGIITGVASGYVTTVETNTYTSRPAAAHNRLTSGVACYIRPYWQPDDSGLPDVFHAYIIAQDGWRHLTANAFAPYYQLTIADQNDPFDPRQIFRFGKRPDGYYKIANEYWQDFEGETWYVQADNGGTWDGTAVNLWKNSGHPAQNWFITNNNTTFRNANCSLVMDVTGGSMTPGTPIEIYTPNGTSAQRICAYLLSNDGRTYSKPNKPDASSYSGNTTVYAGVKTKLAWTSSAKKNSYDKRTYDVTVKNSSGATVLQRTGLTETSCDYTFDAEGAYTIQVRANNAYYYEYYTDGSSSTITVLPADSEPPVITDFSIYSHTDEEIVFDMVATDNVGVSKVGGTLFILGDDSRGLVGTEVKTPVGSIAEAGEGHWHITIPLVDNKYFAGDHHALMIWAEDAASNSTLGEYSPDNLAENNPNPTVFFEQETAKHLTLTLGDTISASDLFGTQGNVGTPGTPVFYMPDNPVLTFDGKHNDNDTYDLYDETYTASIAGTGTYCCNTDRNHDGQLVSVVITVVLPEPELIDIAGAAITLPFVHTPCTGRPITPKVTVTLAGEELEEGTDYEVSYTSNTAIGRATVTVTGIGGYVGTATATFRIARAADGWANLAEGGKGYGRDGKLVTGWMDLDGAKYWFDDGGVMATGWADVVVDGKTMHYYFNPASGNLARGTWMEIDGKKYYFRPSGNAAHGWATIKDKDVDKKYWFDDDFQMVTGWRDIVNDDGVTNHYYFRPSGAMATGWAKIDGKQHFFRQSGNMATGFTSVPDDEYKRYFDEGGNMVTGWQTINGNTYYFRTSGAMQTGAATIDGMVCVFTDKGVLVE